MASERSKHLARFYELLARLEAQQGGLKLLENCSGRMPWPTRGVYFFYADGESCLRWSQKMRVVRVRSTL